MAAIKARVGLKRLRLRATALPELPNVAQVEQHNGTYTFYTPDADALVRYLVRHDVAFEDLEVLPASLEEAFLVLTRENA